MRPPAHALYGAGVAPLFARLPKLVGHSLVSGRCRAIHRGAVLAFSLGFLPLGPAPNPHRCPNARQVPSVSRNGFCYVKCPQDKRDKAQCNERNANFFGRTQLFHGKSGLVNGSRGNQSGKLQALRPAFPHHRSLVGEREMRPICFPMVLEKGAIRFGGPVHGRIWNFSGKRRSTAFSCIDGRFRLRKTVGTCKFSMLRWGISLRPRGLDFSWGQLERCKLERCKLERCQRPFRG